MAQQLAVAPQIDDLTVHLTRLSQRELDVLYLVLLGTTNKVISFKLRISEATVKGHVASATAAACVDNRVQLCLWALSHPSVFAGHGVRPGLHSVKCSCNSIYCTLLRLIRALHSEPTPA